MRARTRCALFLLAALCFPTAGAPALARAGEDAPLELMVTASVSPGTVLVTLSFSRPAVYRFEETRNRLRLWIEGPVDRSAYVERELDSDVVKRIKFDEGDRGTTVVFQLGRRFSSFTSAERRSPFQVVLAFAGEGQALPEDLLSLAPPAQAQPSGAAGEGNTPRPEPGAPAGQPGAPGGAPPPAPLPETSGPMRRVVIDPGHGGEEQGAVSGSGLKEKDLVLDIARRLRDRLQGMGYAAALTRDEDQRLDLDSRAAVANRLKADMFLSIHANSSRRESARGAETYFLSHGSSDDEARRLAMSENEAAGAGADAAAGGASPGNAGRDDLRLILWDMAQSEHLASSSRLADLIQAEMNRVGGTADRGVKQAPFRVLVGADMPAVLVEVGFLTHAEEEKKLASGDHRDEIASALATAVDRFRRERLTAQGDAPR